MSTPLVMSEFPARMQELKKGLPQKEQIDERVQSFGAVPLRKLDSDGDTEVLSGATFTHHFVEAPGDYDYIKYHYVTSGDEVTSKRAPIVLLHGVPDSWFQWQAQMAALANDGFFCVAPDLKGYGQSSKDPGDYRHEGAAVQLTTMLTKIKVDKFYLVTHDRGTVQGDYIAALFPERVLGYVRGEQHLLHFNAALMPQHEMIREAPYNGFLSDPKRAVLLAYLWLGRRPVPDAELGRVVQEFSYDGITKAVPRYFASTSSKGEVLERRNRLMRAWKCPIMILQGYDSASQPREWYVKEELQEHIPNAKVVEVRYMPGGHFWTLESPDETTAAIRDFLKLVR